MIKFQATNLESVPYTLIKNLLFQKHRCIILWNKASFYGRKSDDGTKPYEQRRYYILPFARANSGEPRKAGLRKLENYYMDANSQ